MHDNRAHRIVSPGDKRPHWQGDRMPTEDEIDEVVGEWESGLEPAPYVQLVTDSLRIERHSLLGWRAIRTIHLLDIRQADNK